MKQKLLFLFMLFAAFANAQDITTIHTSGTISLEFVKVSPALRDVVETPFNPNKKDVIRKEHDNPSLEHPDGLQKSFGLDKALQKTYSKPGEGTTLNVLSNWPGLQGAVDPSDNCVAVGPGHIFQMTNNSTSSYIRIWDKAGNVLVANKLTSSITGVNDYGDPNVVYDQQADRFVFLTLSTFLSSKLVVAVSKTNNPTGEYYIYKFSTPNGFPDYPKIGVWGNSYFITTNSNTPTVFALNRNDMLAGQPLGTVQYFKLSSFPKIGFQTGTMVSQAGTLPVPENAPAMLMRVGDDSWGSDVATDHLEIFNITIDWLNSSNSVMTGPFKLNTIEYNSKITRVTEKGTTKTIDPVANTIYDKVQYRNFGDHETIVCSHLCDADNGKAGIRWYELRRSGGDWSIYQQSTYAADVNNRYLSSVSINDEGSIALGYNIAGDTEYPGIRITGRTKADDTDMMTAVETTITQGLAIETSGRYGDYNGMVTDPADGSFWFTAQYNPTTAWTTNLVHFTLGDNALPVSWLSFTAEKTGTRSTLLKWSTANEINNNHFDIERSGDGISYTKISAMAAGKNPNTAQQYSFADNTVMMGTNYYRIKQVDNDGKFSYSIVARITIDVNGISWSLQPNPTTDKTTIIFNNNFKTADIKINNAAGKVVYKTKLLAVNANQQLTINVSNFAKGIYFVNIIADGENKVEKLVVE